MVYSAKQKWERTRMNRYASERRERESGKASSCINSRMVCTQRGIVGTQLLSGLDSDSELVGEK